MRITDEGESMPDLFRRLIIQGSRTDPCMRLAIILTAIRPHLKERIEEKVT